MCIHKVLYHLYDDSLLVNCLVGRLVGWWTDVQMWQIQQQVADYSKVLVSPVDMPVSPVLCTSSLDPQLKLHGLSGTCTSTE